MLRSSSILFQSLSRNVCAAFQQGALPAEQQLQGMATAAATAAPKAQQQQQPRAPRVRKQALELSDEAAARIKQLLEARNMVRVCTLLCVCEELCVARAR